MPSTNQPASGDPPLSPLMYSPKIELLDPNTLKPYARNARVHNKAQVARIVASIRSFGFTNPILITDDLVVVAGHGRLLAAKVIGMERVPVIKLSALSQDEVDAYRIADNRLTELSIWDNDILAIELQNLISLDFKMELTGFEQAQIDIVIGKADAAKTKGLGPADVVPPIQKRAVSALDTLWKLGDHRLLCGDALNPAAYERLMAGGKADMVFTDSPYNCPIDGFVGGKGSIKHREFVQAAGEMSQEEFYAFLRDSHANMAAVCRDGAVVASCMDWRNIATLLAVGDEVFSRLLNICVWNKTNAGMGGNYRSQHEMVPMFKVGTAAHTNMFGLGGTGRNRSNVWTYAGANAFGAQRMDELAMHPTVKPVDLVHDAILDWTKRGQVVLDGFGGSGTTLIASHKCGRVARLLELDPLYCDVIVRRWQAYTGKTATRDGDGLAFDDAADLAAKAEG